MAPEARIEGGQRRKSTVAKLAGKFRRGSAISPETEQLDASGGGRKSSAAFLDRRRSSIASSSSSGPVKLGLPLRVTKSGSEKPKDEDESSQPSVP